MHRAEARYTLPTSDAELIARHGSLIDRVARKIAARVGMKDSAEELWSVGALGLLEAARRFDGSRDVRFETFAEHRIRGAMLDELRRLDHLPRRLRADTERAQKTRASLARTLGREPEADEVASALGIGVAELAELEQLKQPVLPLLDALAVSDGQESAESRLERQNRSRRLSAAIAQLSARLQLVLQLYYVEELTFREVAKVLEVSEARVYQLHGDAVGKLKELLAE
ncbi:MAG: FliA/WhiG family RNA polymerase sigma factor [Myxococcaceae bacterium]|nr:FliA/WhiG family RNA polymerase sigma factor [Myxococcaceae bacterium]